MPVHRFTSRPVSYTHLPDIDVLFELADLFKVFGDSTRLRIMYTISENEMSVLNIAVSYTHLDVYKRQPLLSSLTPEFLETEKSRT